MTRAGCQPTELRRACREVQISTQGVGGCARLLQIQNHGVQQREINNARDTNGDETTVAVAFDEVNAVSSGCKPHPATAPAGSNRSSYGGDEIAEAFGMRATNWWQRECAGRNASERRASLEKDDAQADPTTLSGKADMAGITSEINHPAAAPG